LSAETVGKLAPDLVALVEAYGAELAYAGLIDSPGVLTFATVTVSSAVGARHLIEPGIEPGTAIRQVRAVRPGAIETHEQESKIQGFVSK
jgi:hypothetical protein